MSSLSLVMALLVALSPGALAMSLASDEELASVRGQDWVTLCCIPYGGPPCSWTPLPGSAAQCGTPGYPDVCAVEGGGNQCYVVDVGPSASDTCWFSHNLQDRCTLAMNGWCVTYRLGGCVQHRNSMMFPIGCDCENLGNPYQVGSRGYCAAGSTECEAVVWP
jgi:hypothetical protein